MGIICGLSVQVVALVAVNLFVDWDKEVRKFYQFRLLIWT